LSELVERFRLVPKPVFVSLANAPADRNVFDFDRRDRGGCLCIEQMNRDNLAQPIDKLTRVGGGNRPEFEDDALLPDTDVIK
jgi:hypothetical protein